LLVSFGICVSVLGLEKSEVISLIQRHLVQCQLPLPHAQQKALHDFIMETCVCHHRLYQAFLNGEINLKHTHSHLEICAPPCPLPLCEGTDVATMEKQQVLRELKAADAEKMSEIHRLKEQAKEQLTAELQASLGKKVHCNGKHSTCLLAGTRRCSKGYSDAGNQSYTGAAGPKIEAKFTSGTSTLFKCIVVL
ncbi:hypothetical protein P4O66_011686, partial [Electrophorus voltai]